MNDEHASDVVGQTLLSVRQHRQECLSHIAHAIASSSVRQKRGYDFETTRSSPTVTLPPIAARMSTNPASPCAVGEASPRTRAMPFVAAAAANQYEAEE